jgi:chromate transporter
VAKADVGLPALAAVFLRICTLTFGSGNTATARLRDELVGRGWLLESEYAVSFSVARVAPGTNVLAYCVAVAWYVRRWPGAVACLLAASVPASVIVVLLTMLYERLEAIPVGAAIVSGAMAAVTGILFAACWLIARPHVTRDSWIRVAVLISGALVVSEVFGLSPVLTMLLGGAAGFVWKTR